VLGQLQRGESDKAAKIFSWDADEEQKAPPAPRQAQTSAVPAAPARPAPAPKSTTKIYKLVVASDEGDEFESSLKLTDENGRISGTLVAPDGEEVAIEQAVRTGEALSFDFSLGAGDQAISLSFRGTILDSVVKGSLS
jgi:hypothetical protein